MVTQVPPNAALNEFASFQENDSFSRLQYIFGYFFLILLQLFKWRAVCFKINFFIGYKFLISFADRIYRPVIDQLKYYYIYT